jgi:hypothetical protein
MAPDDADDVSDNGDNNSGVGQAEDGCDSQEDMFDDETVLPTTSPARGSGGNYSTLVSTETAERAYDAMLEGTANLHSSAVTPDATAPKVYSQPTTNGGQERSSRTSTALVNRQMQHDGGLRAAAQLGLKTLVTGAPSRSTVGGGAQSKSNWLNAATSKLRKKAASSKDDNPRATCSLALPKGRQPLNARFVPHDEAICCTNTGYWKCLVCKKPHHTPGAPIKLSVDCCGDRPAAVGKPRTKQRTAAKLVPTTEILLRKDRPWRRREGVPKGTAKASRPAHPVGFPSGRPDNLKQTNKLIRRIGVRVGPAKT